MEVLDAVEPINQFLCDLHGPTSDIARTMGRLVPFPDTIGCLPDADVLDLSLSLSCIPQAVTASVRYATSARASQIETFYDQEFAREGTVVSRMPLAPSRGQVVMQTQLQWHPSCAAAGTTYRVMVDELRGYRSVRVTATYTGYDGSHILEQFADWHSGDAPITAVCQPSAVELTTYASGRRPSTVALYSTHYHCAQTPREQRRELVDNRIRELGLAYREPREGIMFMRNMEFDAETHVVGDDHSSTVTFVGEFQLR